MSKVVAFIGSPRKNGYSTKLVEQAIAGAKEAGAAEIVTYDLNEEGIRGCQGCAYCRKNEGCATQDKLQPMYGDIISADGIIASFPIYFWGIGGQSKVWFDRMYPMMSADFSPRYPGKKVLTIYAQHNPDKDKFINVMDTYNTFFKRFGWELVDSLLNYGSMAADYKIPDELLNKAFAAGKQLVSVPR